jgi:phage baseplate assembly protein W
MDAPPPFLGRGWAFPPGFSAHAAGAELVEGVVDIGQALRILLSTFPGERVMRPGFGLDPGVFSVADPTSISDLKARVASAIARFEPRIRVREIRDRPMPTEGRVDVLVAYDIPSSNARGNLVIPFHETAAPRRPAGGAT